MEKLCFGIMGWKLSSSVWSAFFQFNEILHTDFSAMIMSNKNAVAAETPFYGTQYIFLYHKKQTKQLPKTLHREPQYFSTLLLLYY